MTDRSALSNETHLAEAKRQLRRSVQDRLLSADQLLDEGDRVAAVVAGLREFMEARVVGLYLAMDRELPTAPLIARCRAAGKQVCVPARQPGGKGYAMVRLDDGTELREAHFGVPEPVAPVWMDAGRIDLMLVPGIAFDRHGRRLGHGKGFYDRMLPSCSGYRIGLALSTRLVEQVPAGPRDVPMDTVVTADAVYRSAGSRSHEDLSTTHETLTSKTAGAAGGPAGGKMK